MKLVLLHLYYRSNVIWSVLTAGSISSNLWYQLASVNMSVTMSHCPGGWVEENEGGVRACGHGTVGAGCKSALFSSDERDYTKVYGRAIGYQIQLQMHLDTVPQTFL